MDAMRKRNANVNLDEFLELEKKRRELTLSLIHISEPTRH